MKRYVLVCVSFSADLSNTSCIRPDTHQGLSAHNQSVEDGCKLEAVPKYAQPLLLPNAHVKTCMHAQTVCMGQHKT